MDQVLNIAFFVFHSAWIVFVCTGWVWTRTRPWQLAAIALTAASWFVLGFRYGWGYCPFTDWHWQVRARLGFIDPPSYIQLLLRELTGVELRPGHRRCAGGGHAGARGGTRRCAHASRSHPTTHSPRRGGPGSAAEVNRGSERRVNAARALSALRSNPRPACGSRHPAARSAAARRRRSG